VDSSSTHTPAVSETVADVAQERLNTLLRFRCLAFLLQVFEMTVGIFIGYKCWTFASLSSNKAMIQ